MSLSRDEIVLIHCDFGANTPKGPHLVLELHLGLVALTQGQRSRIVIHLQLSLACDALVDGAHSRILRVQPRPLHVSLLLRVVVFRVDLTDQVRQLFDALGVAGPHMSPRQLLLLRLKVLYRLLSTFYRFLTIVVSVFCLPVASVVVVLVVGQEGAKATARPLHRPVDEGQLRDVVFVDHAKHGLLFLEVGLRLLNLLLVRRLKLSLYN